MFLKAERCILKQKTDAKSLRALNRVKEVFWPILKATDMLKKMAKNRFLFLFGKWQNAL